MRSVLADSNFWLAMALDRHPFHQSVVGWFNALPANSTVLFCRSTQQSFLRLLTNSSVMKGFGLLACTNHEAWDFYRRLLSSPSVGFANENVNHEMAWYQFSDRSIPSTKLWMDAYLAAFAVTSNLEFITFDGAFLQFAGLAVTILVP
jgi:toxin-antitoxin system PIN domain toxin